MLSTACAIESALRSASAACSSAAVFGSVTALSPLCRARSLSSPLSLILLRYLSTKAKFAAATPDGTVDRPVCDACTACASATVSRTKSRTVIPADSMARFARGLDSSRATARSTGDPPDGRAEANSVAGKRSRFCSAISHLAKLSSLSSYETGAERAALASGEALARKPVLSSLEESRLQPVIAAKTTSPSATDKWRMLYYIVENASAAPPLRPCTRNESNAPLSIRRFPFRIVRPSGTAPGRRAATGLGRAGDGSPANPGGLHQDQYDKSAR